MIYCKTDEKVFRDRAFEQLGFLLKGQQPNGAFHTSYYFKEMKNPTGTATVGFNSWDWQHNGYKVDLMFWQAGIFLKRGN